jgi:hypothetical protein
LHEPPAQRLGWHKSIRIFQVIAALLQFPAQIIQRKILILVGIIGAPESIPIVTALHPGIVQTSPDEQAFSLQAVDELLDLRIGQVRQTVKKFK